MKLCPAYREDLGQAKRSEGTIQRQKRGTIKPIIVKSLAVILLVAVCFGYDAIILNSLPRPGFSWIPRLLKSPFHLTSATNTAEFDWFSLKPRADLHYTSCFGTSQCARLKVPLRWQNSSCDKSIAIAIIKLPAPVPPSDPRYGGPVLINPGGPGGSGVEIVQLVGPELAQIVSSEETRNKSGKYFDIVGFDPRGVGLSNPPESCFKSNIATRYINFLHKLSIGSLGSSDVALYNLWALSHSETDACHTDDSDDIRRHMSTASVSRDMVEIIDKESEWREREISSTTDYRTKRYNVGERAGRKNATLQYWGMSYGTLLGQTFASLYPERVGRMVLDGVASLEDYATAQWTANLFDTDSIWDYFYTTCASAGYPTCALAEGNATAADIAYRVSTFLKSLSHSNPIILPSIPGQTPAIVTYSDLISEILTAFYFPIQSFHDLAVIIHGLLKKDEDTLFYVGDNVREMFSWSNHDFFHQELIPAALNSLEITQTIVCSDGEDVTILTLANFTARTLHPNEYISPMFGPPWSQLPLACTALSPTLRPEWRFDGPHDTVRDAAQPILFIGNSADPVTPLVNAKRAAKLFKGAVALEQLSAGHVSLSSPSVCTGMAIKEYFRDGALPKKGTKCEVAMGPWVDAVAVEAAMDDHSMAQHQSLRKIGDAYAKGKYGFMLPPERR